MFSGSRKEFFPADSGQADYLLEAEIHDGKVTVSLTGVPPGEYAVFVYHDRNSNRRVDHKWYGPPAESFAYYRLFTVKLMPPDFADVSFHVGDADIAMEIPLQKFW